RLVRMERGARHECRALHAEVAAERLVETPHDPGPHQGGGHVRPPDDAGSRGAEDLLDVETHTRVAEALEDAAGTLVTLHLEARQPLAQRAVLGIDVETEDVQVETLDRAGDLDPRNHFDA